MYQVVRYEKQIEAGLAKIESGTAEDAGRLITSLQADGLTDHQIYLLFALASARWIDHHGPWIGHGTLNMGPMIHASALMDARHQRLAMLQAAVYVFDLFQAPNYGPYMQPQVSGVQRATPEETRQDLIQQFADGTYQNLSENLFVGLYRQTNGDVRDIMLQMGIQEYGRNEHKLLIALRTLDLLAIDDFAKYGESLLRPAVQYLSSLPKNTLYWERVQAEISTHNLAEQQMRWEGEVGSKLVETLVPQLIEAEHGTEASLFARHLAQGVNLPTLYEALALASSRILIQSGSYDEHIVTGIHCLLNILRDVTIPAALKLPALLISLESARTRTFKDTRHDWLAMPTPSDVTSRSEEELLEAILSTIASDPTGLEAAALTGAYLQQGFDIDQLTQALMHQSLKVGGPFRALHITKMIWGLWRETKLSTHPDRWTHLAAAAAAIARAYPKREQAERILRLW
ncbi:hypothetical protein CIG75_04450 [Tumebacillus algifaecis]|uniref:Uncharacterized protein n=1 Tax=Tumebacillus algifaecis TaxID=1214604 RepID=A0A223CY39_9BACL|nr:hypothetical protein [Tumebacillus algifaecis]ASS74310.1 hypothetical protein CIG75_04450 [Tumebacillus algifaecis]